METLLWWPRRIETLLEPISSLLARIETLLYQVTSSYLTRVEAMKPPFYRYLPPSLPLFRPSFPLSLCPSVPPSLPPSFPLSPLHLQQQQQQLLPTDGPNQVDLGRGGGPVQQQQRLLDAGGHFATIMQDVQQLVRSATTIIAEYLV